MQAKALELRDRATFIPLLAISTEAENEAQHRLLRSAGYGYGSSLVIITRLHADGNSKASYDPYAWGDRTFAHAHSYIEKHWHELKDGDVIDVEFILGEKPTKKISEVQ